MLQPLPAWLPTVAAINGAKDAAGTFRTAHHIPTTGKEGLIVGKIWGNPHVQPDPIIKRQGCQRQPTGAAIGGAIELVRLNYKQGSALFQVSWQHNLGDRFGR